MRQIQELKNATFWLKPTHPVEVEEERVKSSWERETKTLMHYDRGGGERDIAATIIFLYNV